MHYLNKTQDENGKTVYIKRSDVEVDNIFEEENQSILHDLVNKYFVIHADVRAGLMPPTINRFIDRFKTDYLISLSEEEYLLLKEYAEDDYPYEITDNIRNNITSGKWEVMDI